MILNFNFATISFKLRNFDLLPGPDSLAPPQSGEANSHKWHLIDSFVFYWRKYFEIGGILFFAIIS
jgi:hypothetical protein